MLRPLYKLSQTHKRAFLLRRAGSVFAAYSLLFLTITPTIIIITWVLMSKVPPSPYPCTVSVISSSGSSGQFLLVLVLIPPPHVWEQEPQLDQSGQIRLSLVLTSARILVTQNKYNFIHFLTWESEDISQSDGLSFIFENVFSNTSDVTHISTINL